MLVVVGMVLTIIIIIIIIIMKDFCVTQETAMPVTMLMPMPLRIW